MDPKVLPSKIPREAPTPIFVSVSLVSWESISSCFVFVSFLFSTPTPQGEIRGGERESQKSRVFARLQSSELRVMNLLSLFNVVFQKFTHTLTHRSEQGGDYQGEQGVWSGPAPSRHWEICTLGSVLPDCPGVGIGGKEYLQRRGT